MSALELCLLFIVTFANVFLLGIQSRNVNAGRYVAAVATSFGISIANFTFVHYAATGSLAAFAVSAAGGCCGIAAAIWFYQNVMEKRRRGTVEKLTIKVGVELDAETKANLRRVERAAELANRISPEKAYAIGQLIQQQTRIGGM